MRKLANLFVLVFFLFSNKIMAKTDCRIIFDAGSSGTRLYIYEKSENTNVWIEHEGPKAEAIADPVRGIRGKNWSNMAEVVKTIPNALDLVKTTTNGWKAFDWEKNCNLISASVLATAGMRMAEQTEPEKSRILWENIKTALSEKVGKEIPIIARTLTGFEEGLYAWLSIFQERHGNFRFGIAEMGGASAQVAFSCYNCPGSKKVQLGPNKSVSIFSYSFLGLGGDVAFDIFGTSPLCGYGVGESVKKWNQKMCGNTLNFKAPTGIKDPLNFYKGNKNMNVKIPFEKAMGPDWYLTGAFSYLGTQFNIDLCCMRKGKCFDPRTSCFKSVYFQELLNGLGISVESKKASSSWTLGATICQENNCLKNAGGLNCEWSNKGCLFK